jgi:hypothetical protein
MLKVTAQNTVVFMALGLATLGVPPHALAVSPIQLSGAITGIVTDSGGIPQMGAAVMLFNKQERLFQKVFTNDRGEFRFAGLFPDLYTVRVSLGTFIPAVRNRILVQAGKGSMLNVSLNSLFSSIQISYPAGDSKTVMSDDWKWILRTASSTRPVLRFVPGLNPADPTANTRRSALFSGTRGILKVSAGDSGATAGTYSSADLGTAFALATSLFGNHMLQVAGNLGYGSATGVPTAAFRTSYRGSASVASPEVSLTMRQLYFPGRIGSAFTGGDGGTPMLRTMAVSFDDRTQLSDNVRLQYGFSLDSVSFLSHLNYFSPYARLVYDAGANGKFDLALTSGNARGDLAGESTQGPDAELQHDIAALSMFPRISLRGARPKVQRGENVEVGYTVKASSRTFRISAYREAVRNAALTMAASDGLYGGGDILPDLFSGSSIFNAGNYQSTGYSASVTQAIGEHISASLIYGAIGALTAHTTEIESADPDELRAMIRAGRRHAATARIAATSPWSGTHLIASYQWTDHRWLAPGQLYSTQSVRPLPGLNVYVRQPIPTGFLPWRMEATADLRNMLAQGYLPLTVAGQSVTLVQTPRSFRGGLAFIF